MSRSSPTLTNPAAHFYEWAGGTGVLSFYDKENKQSVPVKLPMEFLVLDELSKIVGYNKQEQSGYWSNEVRSTKKDELTVKTKHGVAETGLYENLTKVRSKGGKYAKSIYIATKTAGGYEINNLTASGSALSAWIDFSSQHKVQNGKVVMGKGEKQTSPVGDFYAPVFEYTNASKEEDEAAIALDKDLQEFLKHYLTASPDDDEVSHDAIDPELGKATPEQLADFEARKQKAGMQKPLDVNDFPDDQDTYNRQAVDDVFFNDDEPMPEYQG